MTPIEHVENISHEEARRKNIPTSELQPLVPDEQRRPIRVSYRKRDPDLDPQLVWRGKFDGDDELAVKAPPLYIQEKIHPKALIEDLLRHGKNGGGLSETDAQYQLNLFSDFNGIPPEADRTDFYRHEQNWTNRMILGDSLQVMASLAEREGLAGQVQAIYIDPPYGIKFNSNFQWSTTRRDSGGEKPENFTREPEQVKAFRDTWADGIHSYLSYLRDRLILARELLTESGSVFVQIGDENVHRVRALMDEIFGEENFNTQINYATTSGLGGDRLSKSTNYILWFCKDIKQFKFRQLLHKKEIGGPGASAYTKMSEDPAKGYYALDNITSANHGQGVGQTGFDHFIYNGQKYTPGKGSFKTNKTGMERLGRASRLGVSSNGKLGYIRYLSDFPYFPLNDTWTDTLGQNQFGGDKIYVVQTGLTIVRRCLLMATDPGDLVLDPTCGSGTTAYVAEQWGRRWITIDTSRVALALARARLMGAKFPYYLMEDSAAGASKERELGNPRAALPGPYGENVAYGFVCERVPHITLKAIANNAEIDEIWARWQKIMEPLAEKLNRAMGKSWQEWEIPGRPAEPWPKRACELHGLLAKAYRVKMPEGKTRPLLAELNEILGSHYKKIEQLPQSPETQWPDEAARLHAEWRKARLERQREIDASIAARAEFETLYDRPYEDRRKVRVSGPFTVESISPHRVLNIGPDNETIDPQAARAGEDCRDFERMILNNLAMSGVQQSSKDGKINFTSLAPWPGQLVCADGRFQEGGKEKRAAIMIGPEFGTVSRPDLASAAREAAESGFDCLISCGFSFDAMTSELSRLGSLPILKARMNADLQMGELKNNGKGNLFVIFGEPDIEIKAEESNDAPTGNYIAKLNGIDVFYPGSGEIRSDEAKDVACWFVDTDYDGESFFVRQAYFPGQADPWKALKGTLKAEIDEEAWQALRKDVSRPFPPPKTGLIAVKAINHLGDEVMKVFRVPPKQSRHAMPD